MKVLLGVTGGIAAYKALELVRLFVKAGHEVQVVMTAGAKAFIQPLSFQALSGKPVRDSLFDENQEAGMGHIELARWPDVIVIAPASAETLAKLRMGRADDLLMTLCVATDKPIMIAPAMNRLMWANAATQDNVQVLAQRGFEVLAPASGEQACGEVGEGRLPEPQAINDALDRFMANYQSKITQNYQAWSKIQGFWQGKRLLITAGPTHEAIDPVRFIGNRSSGKMGMAIADMAQQAGAEVTVIAGPIHLPTPKNVSRINVTSADDMLSEVQSQYAKANVFISAAAVADFKVAKPAEHKLKKQADENALTLTLVKNPDIVAWVASQPNKPFVVGFAAETQQVLGYAKKKLTAKNLDMICANLVGEDKGFEKDDNALTLITQVKQQTLPLSSKQQQAVALLAFICDEY